MSHWTPAVGAVALGLLAAAAQEVVVCSSQPAVELGPGARASAVVFARDLATAGSLTTSSLVLAPGARIVYERSAGVANQRLVGDLLLEGDARFVNDNAWTHMAHMLRIEGRLRGAGTLTIDGAADGGVLLAGDSRAVFDGPIEVVGGNLLVGGDGALGAPEVPTTLRGGRLSLYWGATSERLVFAGDAALHTGVDVTLRGDVEVARGATARLDTGGGNPGRLVGTLAGEGALVLRGGGRNPALALTPFTLAGDAPNALLGSTTVERGTLALAKAPGVAAVVGELRLGGGDNLAAVRLDADEQIRDQAALVTMGDQRAVFWSNGHRETLGVLKLGSDAAVRMGPGPDRVRFAASADEPWRDGCELIVEGWEGALDGGGEDQLAFGSEGASLARAQLAALGFRDPAGRPPGLYGARLGPGNEVLPDGPVTPRADNPFAIGPAEDALRAQLYEREGLALLTGPESPLASGSVLTFLGDSITWQHGFLGRIERALAAGEGTRGRGIELRNRGINGGGVRDLRAGSEGQSHAGGRPGGASDAPQASCAEILALDRPVAVVIFIGINDVTWRGTTAEEFSVALGELVRTAQGAGAAVVVATPFLAGERPDGGNAHDPAIERFAALTRDVARDEGATLVDLRGAAVAWLRNHARRLRRDGRLEFEELGLLTYDGIHPTDVGNDLIADLLADGLRRALAP